MLNPNLDLSVFMRVSQIRVVYIQHNIGVESPHKSPKFLITGPKSQVQAQRERGIWTQGCIYNIIGQPPLPAQHKKTGGQQEG